MRCPVCDAENPDTALECALCGKELQRPAPPETAPAAEPLPGLERTAAEATFAPGAAASFAELEPTAVGKPDEAVDVQPIDVVRSAVEADEGAQPFWDTAAPDLTVDRAVDAGARTPAPEGDGLCAYCGEYSLDALCANCGQRRDRFTSAPTRAAAPAAGASAPLLCPACFARVPAGPRCIECGVPFPPSMGGAEP